MKFQRTQLSLGWGHVPHSTTPWFPREVLFLGIFFALLAVNGRLPAELKFRADSEIISEERLQKIHTGDMSLPISRQCFFLVVANIPHSMANQKHYSHLSSGASSVWNSCTCSSDFILQVNQWWCFKNYCCWLLSQANKICIVDVI